MRLPHWIVTLLWLPDEGSSVAGGVDTLHAVILGTTMIASFGVFAVAFYLVARYRRREDDATTEPVVASIRREVTIAAVLLCLFVGWWIIGFRQYVNIETPPDDPDTMTVYLVARQWMWKFSYADGRSAENTLVVPQGRTVKLAMTSRDVIHSFYVPGFRIKQDVVPGRYTTAWFKADVPGRYDILCAEYCGVDHSYMRGTIVVLEPAAYEKWLDDPSRDRSGEVDLVSRGREVAVKRSCTSCHPIGAEPGVGPSWAGLYNSWTDLQGGTRILADEAYLTRSMMEPNADITLGYKPLMPSYAGVLDPAETSALVEYIKSLRAPEDPGVVLPKLTESADAGAGAGGTP